MSYTQPVKVGDIITETVINLGEKGDGIALHDGFVIIVPDGQIEKSYQLRVRKVYQTFALAEIVKEVA